MKVRTGMHFGVDMVNLKCQVNTVHFSSITEKWKFYFFVFLTVQPLFLTNSVHIFTGYSLKLQAQDLEFL